MLTIAADCCMSRRVAYMQKSLQSEVQHLKDPHLDEEERKSIKRTSISQSSGVHNISRNTSFRDTLSIPNRNGTKLFPAGYSNQHRQFITLVCVSTTNYLFCNSHFLSTNRHVAHNSVSDKAIRIYILQNTYSICQ